MIGFLAWALALGDPRRPPFEMGQFLGCWARQAARGLYAWFAFIWFAIAIAIWAAGSVPALCFGLVFFLGALWWLLTSLESAWRKGWRTAPSSQRKQRA